ncbi:MAG: energy-coupling factor ABC transporter ATP-binding protein [Lachnospiraceae bacterium]|jgi:energy-coupling factor transport system ATP-binding protein
MALIEFNDVSFQYPNGFSAVEHVNLSVERGESIAIVGQNGAGKTTTVKMMNGLLKPTEGTVIVDGMNTRDFTAAQLSRKTGYVFQNPDDQIFHNTVEDEIRFGPQVLKFDSKKTDEMVAFAAKLTGLENSLDVNPYNLPLSIRKFVTIASVIAMDVEILVLDEPTAGQDQYGIRILENILKVLLEKGKTIITITHDMEYVVNNFEKVVVMAHKNILEIDHPRKIFMEDALLEESMLTPPYVSSLVKDLGIQEEIITHDELIHYLVSHK